MVLHAFASKHARPEAPTSSAVEHNERVATAQLCAWTGLLEGLTEDGICRSLAGAAGYRPSDLAASTVSRAKRGNSTYRRFSRHVSATSAAYVTSTNGSAYSDR